MGKNRRFNNSQSPKPIQEKALLEEEPVKEEIVPEVEEEVEVEAIVDGVDMSLNIRMKPEVTPNNQIAILGKGTKLFVLDPKKEYEGSGEKWYKVRLSKANNEGDKIDPTKNGYAMKKYIKLI